MVGQAETGERVSKTFLPAVSSAIFLALMASAFADGSTVQSKDYDVRVHVTDSEGQSVPGFYGHLCVRIEFAHSDGSAGRSAPYQRCVPLLSPTDGEGVARAHFPDVHWLGNETPASGRMFLVTLDGKTKYQAQFFRLLGATVMACDHTRAASAPSCANANDVPVLLPIPAHCVPGLPISAVDSLDCRGFNPTGALDAVNPQYGSLSLRPASDSLIDKTHPAIGAPNTLGGTSGKAHDSGTF
jgi:hypothetical protein